MTINKLIEELQRLKIRYPRAVICVQESPGVYVEDNIKIFVNANQISGSYYPKSGKSMPRKDYVMLVIKEDKGLNESK